MNSNDMKQFKLKLHTQTANDEVLLFNSSDLPNVKQHDLLKIFQDNANYFLFKVKTVKDAGLPRDCISMDQALAHLFGMTIFPPTYVLKAEPEDFTIDLLEVTFKDQYISRSDMWRMKKHLVGSCAYIDQKIEYSDVRAQVSELWVDSVRAPCGYISDHTNFVLRSYTAKVYVFVQMSSEMWEYDAYGYLQFERAIYGFLKVLFTKWKEKKCCHELTLVLFSRTFYEKTEFKDFPEEVQGSVRTDYRGLFYIDFYKCVVHSQKLEDCTPLLTTLKKLFHKYDELTSVPGCPKGKNSTSAEGNFLEAINMSLNVFERHNVDRNFDGTGQIVVCITPGVGVFDVDRDMTILTKERMIDNGIGSDLICLGQQPLHAVPLFKFHQKLPDNLRSTPKSKFMKKSNQPIQYDFNIPHWINHSFYTSNPFPDKGTTNIKFIPRIHAPLLKTKQFNRRMSSPFSCKSVTDEPDELPNVKRLNYDEYDKQVFVYHKPSVQMQTGDGATFKRSTPDTYKKKMLKTGDGMRQPMSPESRRHSRPVHIPLHKSYGRIMKSQEGLASSLGVAGYLEKHLNNKQKEDDFEVRPIVGSATLSRNVLKDGPSSPMPRRALFNPFNPLQMFAPLTANRRRWVHTYPRGPQGEALVLHHRNHSLAKSRIHYQSSESTDDEGGLMYPMTMAESPSNATTSKPGVGSLGSAVNFSIQRSISASFEDSSSTKGAPSLASSASSRAVGGLREYIDSSPNEGSFVAFQGVRSAKPISSFGLSWMWGIAGDIQWTTDVYTGLDWKSLKCPACLPITTDYCPLQSHLQSAYTEHTYTLIPDDMNFSDEKGDEDRKDIGRDYQSARELFLELINQRLCQGYQMIKQSKRLRNTDSSSSCATLTSPASNGSYGSFATGASPMYSSSGNSDSEETPNCFMLSHGRQYHILKMSSEEDKIEVKIYRPRHPSDPVAISYNYMLWPITREEFQTASTTFAHIRAEDQFWNHLDDYICYPDDSMTQNIIYWRTKFVAVAVPTKRLHLLKSANENNAGPKRFDVFNSCGCQTPTKNCHETGECTALFDGFVRFLEHLNKFKRNNAQNARKSWKSHTSGSFAKSYQATPTTGGGPNSNQATPTPPRATSSTPTSERSTPVRFEPPPPTLSGHLIQRSDIHHPVPLKHTDSYSSSSSEGKKISINSEMSEIIEAMKHEQTGISFLPEKSGVPKHSFVSYEVVHWAIENIEGIDTIKDACDYFERIRSYRFFTHLTGEGAFCYGYLLYTLNQEQQNFELEDPTSYQFHHIPPTGCYTQLQNRWFEVAFKRSDIENDQLCSHHRSLNVLSEGPPRKRSGAFFIPSNKRHSHHEKLPKLVNNCVKIPLLNKSRSQRSEWFQIKYSSATHCGVDTFAFCFEVQWLIATATCLFNQLQLWYRDAGRCELYFFPVPCEPFAFPRAGVTGPLRAPLFVKLNLAELNSDSVIFKEHLQSPEKYRLMIIEFMDGILKRFGFLRDLFYGDDSKRELNPNNLSQNYVHFTGQILAQIPVRDRSVQRNSISLRSRTLAAQMVSAPAVTHSELDGTGFYWSYNHMQTKRWRHAALDECQPAELEKDFVAFCSNTNSRLYNFYHDFCDTIDYVT